jgi:hypothetical protein
MTGSDYYGTSPSVWMSLGFTRKLVAPGADEAE